MLGIMDFNVCLPRNRMTLQEMADRAGVPTQSLSDYLCVNEKPILSAKEETFDCAFIAASELLDRHPGVRDKISLVITGTVYSDRKLAWYPSAVAIKRLNLSNSYGLDIQHGCNSTLAALQMASKWMRESQGYALILVADRLSELVDYTDPNHRCLFSFADGGAAILLSTRSEESSFALQRFSGSTAAEFSESQFLLRHSPTLWMNEDENEDRALIETYRQRYVENIKSVLSISDPYVLIMNQGDHKLIRYLENHLPHKPIMTIRTHAQYGHVGNTDVMIGLLEIKKNPEKFPAQIVLASSALGYSFSAMSLVQTESAA